MSRFYERMSVEFREVLRELENKKVAVLGHMRPDGDCIGSQVALCRCLNAVGSEAVCVNRHAVPRTQQSFVGDTPFYLSAGFKAAGHIGVTVDCADIARIGGELESQFDGIFANIDHHISNGRYARHNFIHAGSSATAEILAGMFFDNGLPIDPVAAQALYVGIATDTGQFRFASTTRQVFEICRRLTELGADPAAAAMHLYENESMEKLQLLQRFLASLRFECEGRVCIGLLKNGIYGETGAATEDSEGLVDYARAIRGVEIGVLVEERDGAIKGSFRAKEPVHRVDRLAKQFNGGGHACAAGFNCEDTLEHFYPRLVHALKEHFQSLAAAPGA